MRTCIVLFGVLVASAYGAVSSAAQESTVRNDAALKVGSKKFTESVVLGEILTHLARHTGGSAEHFSEMGGTRLLWNALLNGDIDVYPEYTGTITQEILANQGIGGLEQIRSALQAQGIGVSAPLGFNNTYAIGMKEEMAERLGIKRISDLTAHPGLRLGFSNEFMNRGDGWPGLRQRYALPQQDVKGLDHDLAYRGLESDGLDVMDLYSTDAEIKFYRLRTLQDDLGYFPEYRVVLLYRQDMARRSPAVIDQLLQLEGLIPAAEMVAMNARAKLDKVPAAQVAADFLRVRLGIGIQVEHQGLWQRLVQRSGEHLLLVGLSLAASILLAIPLGVVAARRRHLGQVILGIVGVVQTIPALALLVLMIPLLGIGMPSALAALFLYSLLPIVRNTYTGLSEISPPIRESALALGLSPGARLRLIELPLASRSILAGIKTSAVINVGFATLGALIAAGGYGQPILTGIRLADSAMILEGAVPAAVLALAVQGAFEGIERLFVPLGLRLKAAGEAQ
jgi:osmoprotectant transport system permease protein